MPTHAAHDIRLLLGAVDLFPALIEAMDAAQREVRLETYIFDTSGAGADVAHAMVRAALRGVTVCLVVDGVGTRELPQIWRNRFDQSGVQYRVYAPLSPGGLWLPSRWRRLHRKLCVVDQTLAFCGGINIMDDFLDPHVKGLLPKARLDYAVSLRGPLVRAVHDTMTQLWSRLEAVRELRSKDVMAALDALLSADQSVHLSSRGSAQLVLRDNVLHRTHIERAYRKAIGVAHKDIVLACAYFFPGLRLRRALVMAAQRGVRVRLLLQGHYEYFLPYRASRQLYGQLLAAGVEIYEYHASFLHAKVAVVDGMWTTVGSSNLDPLSLLLAREANVVVEDSSFATSLLEPLNRAIRQDSTRLEKAQFADRPAWQRLKDRLAYSLMRITLFLSGNDY